MEFTSLIHLKDLYKEMHLESSAATIEQLNSALDLPLEQPSQFPSQHCSRVSKTCIVYDVTADV